MKHFKTMLSVTLLTFLIVSCGEKKTTASDSNASDSNPAQSTPITTLADIELTATPLDSIDFNNWTGNWETDGVAYMNFRDSLGLKSMTYFDVPKADLTALLNLQPAKTRFYLGLQPVDSTGVPSGFLPHVLLVGTNANGVLDKNHIYDYSRPCPPRCPR